LILKLSNGAGPLPHFGQRSNEPTSKSFAPLLFGCIHRIMP